MLVKLKGYYNQGGDLLPPETIINLPDEKANTLIENDGAEAYIPNNENESDKNIEEGSQDNTQTENGGEGFKNNDSDGSAENNSEETTLKKGKTGVK